MQLLDTLGLDPFVADFDRIAQRVLGGMSSRPSPSAALPFDVVRRGDALVLEFDMPGADWQDLAISVEGRVLTVSAERVPAHNEGDVVFARGRFAGAFRQQIALPEGLDLDAVEAAWEHGVLSLRIPVAQNARPRRIEVRGGPDTVTRATGAGEQRQQIQGTPA